MRSRKLNKLVCFATLLVLFVSPAFCKPIFRDNYCDDTFGNYTTTSQFSENLHTLLNTITSNTHVDYGFYNLSVGRDLDIVNGVALCRGDIPTPDCRDCIRNATAKVTAVCPNQKAAIVWYETCMFRYSSQTIFKGEMSQPRYDSVTGVHATDPKRFNRTVSTLMTQLAREAALGDSRRKFATGVATVSRNTRVYGLSQCIPDLEPYDCIDCLRLVLNYTLADCCYGEVGVEAAGLTCSLKFDNHRFYNSAAVLPPLQSPAPAPFFFLPPHPPISMITKTGDKSNGVKVAIVTVIPTLASLMLIVILIMVYYSRRRKQQSLNTGNVEEDESGMVESLRLDYKVLKTATDNFSDSNKLGDGGFGTIYKGTIPSTGQMIAVKRLSDNSEQGEKEFQSEALLLAKLQHKNLVKCLGYSAAKAERLLVFDFYPTRVWIFFYSTQSNALT